MAEAFSIEAELEDTEADEHVELHCDPCKAEDAVVDVKGYCINCDEHLCETCYDFHLKPLPCRNHILQDATVMPKQKVKQQYKPFCKSLCRLHVDKELILYCKKHDDLCCETCVLTGHYKCKIDDCVEDLGSIDATDEFRAFEQRIENAVADCENNRQLANKNLDKINDIYDKTIDEVKKTLDVVKLNDIGKMNGIVQTCETVQEQLEHWRRKKDNLTEVEGNKQLYILMKRTEKQLQLTEHTLKDIENENRPVDYDFKPCIGSCVALGNIMKIGKKINVKNVNDDNKCTISDIVVVSNGRLIAADKANRSIKLINTKSGEVVSTLEVESESHLMAASDDGDVYVGLPDSRKIVHFICKSTEIIKSREISIDDKVCSFALSKNKFKMLVDSKDNLYETDLDGHLLKNIANSVFSELNIKDQPVCTRPTHCVANEETGSLIVTCWKNDSVVEITKDGKAHIICQSKELPSPHGITIDNDSNFLVCSHTAKNIVKVRPNGYCANLFPTKLAFTPHAIAYDRPTRRLYVGGIDNSIWIWDL